MVAADAATCCAWAHTFESSWSCARSVTTTKSHGCQFDDDGERRPASRMRSSCSGGSAWSVYWRTSRRARMASHVSTPFPLPGQRGMNPSGLLVDDAKASSEARHQPVYCVAHGARGDAGADEEPTVEQEPALGGRRQ